ncbi:MAG: hypothetical protein KIB53_06940 [Paraclostridium bifermentans]|uniref:hypothetical protein n=1 Tax=Paraclostridium bifermentans TaxID=1490 RepID=UPI00241F0692|nr:hypothetical protein [Paraclostridium bifermentans]MBS5953543.1 hypothetical protein [Paraclostridium bifermentans]
MEKIFEMEAEYLEQFWLEGSDESEDDEQDIGFENFNREEQSDAFIDYRCIPF